MILGNVFSNIVSLYINIEIHYFLRVHCDIDDMFFQGAKYDMFFPSVNSDIENMFFFPSANYDVEDLFFSRANNDIEDMVF